jgi:hypothetical protein
MWSLLGDRIDAARASMFGEPRDGGVEPRAM